MTSGRRSRRRRRRRSTRVARASSSETRTASQLPRGSRRDAPSARTTSVTPHADRRGETSSSRASTPPSETAPSAPAVPDFPDVDAIRQHVARDVNALADAQAPLVPPPRPPPRRRRHRRRLPLPPRRDRRGDFAKPLLRRFEDPSEQCRETATDAFASLARRSDAVLELLPYAIPVLRDRLGPADEDSRNPREPSEEVRARTHALLRALLDSAETGVAAYASTPSGSSCTRWRMRTPTSLSSRVRVSETLVTHLGRRLAPVSKRLAWSFALT